MTNAPSSTNPNAAGGDSWCRHYAVGPHLIPVPADAPLPVAEPLPEWLKRSKPLTHALPLPAGYGSSAAQADLSSNSHRQRKPRHPPPDGLKTAAQAAAKLNCSIKTLNGHVAAGELKYIVIGRGRKRTRRMFSDADLNEFITDKARKDAPCPSTRTETAVRRSSISTSKSTVIGFMEARSKRRAEKPKP